VNFTFASPCPPPRPPRAACTPVCALRAGSSAPRRRTGSSATRAAALPTMPRRRREAAGACSTPGRGGRGRGPTDGRGGPRSLGRGPVGLTRRCSTISIKPGRSSGRGTTPPRSGRGAATALRSRSGCRICRRRASSHTPFEYSLVAARCRNGSAPNGPRIATLGLTSRPRARAQISGKLQAAGAQLARGNTAPIRRFVGAAICDRSPAQPCGFGL
jgi:hypothetical protein